MTHGLDIDDGTTAGRVLDALASAATEYRTRFQMALGAALELVAPHWLLDWMSQSAAPEWVELWLAAQGIQLPEAVSCAVEGDVPVGSDGGERQAAYPLPRKESVT